MIIFNTTFHIETATGNRFLKWLKEEYIPTAIKNAWLSLPQLTRVMGCDETEGLNYSLQFQVKDIETLNRWYDEYGNPLNEILKKEFNDKVAGFSTLLEVIDIENIG